MLYRGNISSRSFSNSEANASELLEDLKEMCPRVDHEQMTVWDLSLKSPVPQKDEGSNEIFKRKFSRNSHTLA